MTTLTAYKSFLLISCDYNSVMNNPAKEDGRFVVDAANVEASLQAIALLDEIEKGADAFGDITVSFNQFSGKVLLTWEGGPMRIINPRLAKGSREHIRNLINKRCGLIENNPPESLCLVIDGWDKK